MPDSAATFYFCSRVSTAKPPTHTATALAGEPEKVCNKCQQVIVVLTADVRDQNLDGGTAGEAIDPGRNELPAAQGHKSALPVAMPSMQGCVN
jgi:hypothetical protein